MQRRGGGIKALDAGIANSKLQDKILVQYIPDPMPPNNKDQVLAGDHDPVLLVTGIHIGWEGNSIALAGMTTVALATTWYSSLYPILVNQDTSIEWTISLT